MPVVRSEYADDFFCLFERESDAGRFAEVLVKRLGRYSLELAQAKTKLIRFGRFARRDCQRQDEGYRTPSTCLASCMTAAPVATVRST